jgi:hypothetical protein
VRAILVRYPDTMSFGVAPSCSRAKVGALAASALGYGLVRSTAAVADLILLHPAPTLGRALNDTGRRWGSRGRGASRLLVGVSNEIVGLPESVPDPQPSCRGWSICARNIPRLDGNLA